MSYTIIETGGKQYKAEVNGILDVEKIEAKEGSKIKFDKVLFYSGEGDRVLVGAPYLKGAVVEAEVQRQYRDKKVISFKYIRRENGAKTKIGHRQSLTRVKITGIQHGA